MTTRMKTQQFEERSTCARCGKVTTEANPVSSKKYVAFHNYEMWHVGCYEEHLDEEFEETVDFLKNRKG